MFRTEFPFLEILFFRNGSSMPVSELFEPDLRVCDVREEGSDGLLVLNGRLSAAAMEQTMADIFGLKVKVCYGAGFRQRYLPSSKPLNELNYRSMHMTEDVVII